MAGRSTGQLVNAGDSRFDSQRGCHSTRGEEAQSMNIEAARAVAMQYVRLLALRDGQNARR